MSIPASPASSLPPVTDSWMSTRSSSGDSPSSSCPAVLTPTIRRMPLEVALSALMNGEKTFVKTSSGRATQRATGSAFWIA